MEECNYLLNMGTNKIIIKGIKYLAGALPLLFIGPSLIYNAFMNQQRYGITL
jgi:hypothetical protein